jgi:digeranylgeranylglycerophospholipid reductase
MMYDVAIVGAGPAGLMAAKTAAEKGLKVVLIEKKSTVSTVTRACCQLLIMDEDFEGESVQLKEGKILFPNNSFEVDYTGPTCKVTDKYYISPSGHKIHFSYPDKKPIVIKYDKGLLLQGLLEKCEKSGVAFKHCTIAYDATDTGEGVELSVTSRGEKSTIMAKKLIAADGVNSRIVASLGMNKERIYFTTALCILCFMEGVRDFEPTAIKSYFGLCYKSNVPVIMGPSLGDEKVASLIIMGNQKQRPEQVFQNVTTRSALSPLFEKARVVNKVGCSVKAYTSMRVPCKNNVLVIGDAAGYVEVEIQGGLMCGYRAGNAVCQELAGERGFEHYIQWWQTSFEFNSDDYLRVAQGFALVPTYTDNELDYLFALIEDEVLEGTYNQYKSPKLMWDAFLKHRDRIAKERPDLYEKIKSKKLTLSDVL